MNFLRGWGGVVIITLMVTALLAGCVSAVFFGVTSFFQRFEFNIDNAQRQGTWEQTFAVVPEVAVETANGGISVQTWELEQVEVVATYRYKDEEFKFEPIIEETEAGLRLSYTRNGDPRAVSFALKVPEDTRLDLSSGNGSIDISGPGSAPLDLYTGNGSIQLADWEGDVVERTGNGSIELNLDLLSVGDYDLNSGNGKIVLSVHPDSQLTVEASTGNGRFDQQLPGLWEIRAQGKRFEGTYNGGGAQLKLQSGNGNIIIQER
ncbi:MAG: DUF4097 domain-containing protein [Firmicutes bacterium]|nr:DUF4097 domain-containing protein [Bacillota bacterium]